ADQLETGERTVTEVQLGIGELSGRVALVVRCDLDRQCRGGRACRSHLVLQRNREVVVPSQPEEPHQHGAERTRGQLSALRQRTLVARRDRPRSAWREREARPETVRRRSDRRRRRSWPRERAKTRTTQRLTGNRANEIAMAAWRMPRMLA